MYRKLQYIHYRVMYRFQYSWYTVSVLAIVMMTTGLYLAIKGTGGLQIRICILCIPFVVVALLKQVIELCNNFTASSSNFRGSFLKNSYLTEFEKCSLRSCPTLSFQLSSFTVSRSTYPTIMNDFVISNLITLLCQ